MVYDNHVFWPGDLDIWHDVDHQTPPRYHQYQPPYQLSWPHTSKGCWDVNHCAVIFCQIWIFVTEWQTDAMSPSCSIHKMASVIMIIHMYWIFLLDDNFRFYFIGKLFLVDNQEVMVVFQVQALMAVKLNLLIHQIRWIWNWMGRPNWMTHHLNVNSIINNPKPCIPT